MRSSSDDGVKYRYRVALSSDIESKTGMISTVKYVVNLRYGLYGSRRSYARNKNGCGKEYVINKPCATNGCKTGLV